MPTSSPLPLPPRPVGKHAIVFGGSMTGLISAGVLSRYFERVTLVERDRFPDGPNPRKGIPQAQHAHALLMRGLNIIADTFPGVLEDLEAAGAAVVDVGDSTAAFGAGGWRRRYHVGVRASSQSRLLIDWVVRKRLLTFANVRILDGREVVGLKTSADRALITGLQLQAPGGGQEETLEGDWVVDASGRGSRMPQWLESLGYPRVEETHIHVDVGYVSRLYQKPPGFAPGWDMLALTPKLPQQRRLGLILSIEGNRWLVQLAGWLGEVPSADNAAFLEFARGLPQPHLYEAIKNAEPIGPINSHRFPHNQRRHYERMPRFPEGLAVVGDAVCSFNPIYGQGMTSSALQVQAMGESLREGLHGASTRYRQRAGQLLNGLWTLATLGDLSIPEVKGKRPPGFGLIHWYVDRLQTLTNYDEGAMKTFTRVQHMLESPTALFSPRMLMKVLTAQPDKAALIPGPAPIAATPRQAA
ncbi:hypothetical protein JQX13_45490 [Archangium violaceum]|uniref:FAD-dependent oxidoreductase n=1 Tax=Archangium violaceum TaxID=83451 RepID=UPI00193C8539|nr:hypothetical protein [Archangium violaceum]QRK07224.1 hypothetical protein JQX13_45490 [Archangium violaceum]